ncbi:MAG TPA: hypothetical protein VE985_08510 [Gaiellaceae bacterium]|nr:hypothetical protein [Gaiellaceae bacterium]
MRGLLKGFVVVALIAAVVVPSASAKSKPHAKLSILPLPASSLGAEARSLPLESDSGVVGNEDSFATGLPTTPNRWYVHAPVPQKTGRISGYALDYGDGTSGGAGVTEVSTSVDQYKTSGAAKSMLVFWSKWELNQLVSSTFKGGLTATVKKENKQAAAVGDWGYFAALVTYRAANIAPLFGFDEQFTEGRYVADATVWAGTAAKAKKLGVALAKKLDARITQALAGRLHAKPVKLPANPVAGPPSGGPDLSSLALTTTDVGGQSVAILQNYQGDPFALSYYEVAMSPAGPFGVLNQGIAWFQTANEANFNADVVADHFAPTQSPIDLSGIGDGARGAVGNDSSGGSATVVFASGRLEEFVDITSTTAIQQSQVVSLAQTMANKINAAGLGG